MFRPESTTAFRPAVSADDWKTIMMAIKTYSHNVEYRELLGRLERQAVLNGIIEPTPPLAEIVCGAELGLSHTRAC